MLLLRHRPGPGGGGEVHHPVPQRHRLWAGAGAGGRRLFRSVIAFGQVRVLEDDGEKRAALEALGERFNPGQPESLEKEIAATWNSVCVLELEIEHLTGKEAKELRKRRAGQ